IHHREHMLFVLLGVAQRRERVGGLTRLRHENRESACRQRNLAVAELGSDVDLDWEARKALEPIFCDQSSVIGGAASGHRDALEGAKVERQVTRQPHALGGHIDIMSERVAGELRLLVNLLCHEVAIIALVDEEGRGRVSEHGTFDFAAFGVVDFDALARHFMAKEIHEQPEVVGHTLAHYIDMTAERVRLPGDLPFDFRTLERVAMSACGTAYYAGLVAKYWFERFARLPIEIDVASEFRYREVPLSAGGLSIFVSQSGETADT